MYPIAYASTFHGLTRSVVNRVGPEVTLTDFPGAVRELNSTLRLGWDDVDCEVLSLLLIQLQKAYRFGAEVHMEPRFGENSAVHSLHTIIKWNLFLQRAERSCGDWDAFRNDPNIERARLEGSLALVLHDMGEIFGELSSLSQRSQAGVDDDHKENLEYSFFRYALYKAYESVELDNSESFHLSMEDLRKRLAIKGGNFSQEDEASHLAALPPLPSVSPEAKKRIDRMLDAFRMIEGLDEKRGDPFSEWLEAALKVVEKDEGSAHMTRFRTRDPRNRDIEIFYSEDETGGLSEENSRSPARGVLRDEAERSIPFECMMEPRVRSGLRYSEQPIPKLIRGAQKMEGEAPLQALHRVLIEGHYKRMLESASRAPKVIDRALLKTPSDVEKEVEGLIERKRRFTHSTVQAVFLAAQEFLPSKSDPSGGDSYRRVAAINHCCQRALRELTDNEHLGAFSVSDVRAEVMRLRETAQAMLLKEYRAARYEMGLLRGERIHLPRVITRAFFMDLLRAQMMAIIHEGYVPPSEGTILDYDEIPSPVRKHLKRIPWRGDLSAAFNPLPA